MRGIRAIVCALIALLYTPGFAATILVDTFDTLDGWQKLTFGEASVELVEEGFRGPSVKTTANLASALLARWLPVDKLRGTTVLVRCTVKLEDLRRGPQEYSTAKIHIAVRDGRQLRHFATRLEGSADWHEETLVAEIPSTASGVFLTLGIECATGTALFDSLAVETDQTALRTIDLSPVANETLTDDAPGDGHGFIDDGPNDLRALPTGLVTLLDIPFDIAPPERNNGKACIVLRGEQRPNYPEAVTVPIPGGVVAEKIYLLIAAAWGEKSRPTPCMICDAQFWDGRVGHFSVFEGRQIGPLNNPQDLEQWRVAWRGKNGRGQTVGLGVCEWTVYDRTPIQSITFGAYQGAVPVIVGLTIKEAKAAIVSEEVYDTAESAAEEY